MTTGGHALRKKGRLGISLPPKRQDLFKHGMVRKAVVPDAETGGFLFESAWTQAAIEPAAARPACEKARGK